MIRSYRDLILLPTFEERYEYLRLAQQVGAATFASDRYLNQRFYKSKEWRQARDIVLIRDNGCDLGIQDREIFDRPIVHHINPITPEDIEMFNPNIINPDNLICTSHNTHNAITYGDISLLAVMPIERRKGDTDLWKAFSRT